jgi:hypothetical protein
MATEAQRAARALMDRRVERFESRYPMAESRKRLEATLSRARPEGRVVFVPEWREADGKALLDASFSPPPRVGVMLKTLSLALTLLILATAWAMLTGAAGSSASWLLGLSTGLAMLAMPWIFVGMGSSRLAEEARITRAIRAALVDEEEKLPPAKKWDDD